MQQELCKEKYSQKKYFNAHQKTHYFSYQTLSLKGFNKYKVKLSLSRDKLKKKVILKYQIIGRLE